MSGVDPARESCQWFSSASARLHPHTLRVTAPRLPSARQRAFFIAENLVPAVSPSLLSSPAACLGCFFPSTHMREVGGVGRSRSYSTRARPSSSIHVVATARPHFYRFCGRWYLLASGTAGGCSSREVRGRSGRPARGGLHPRTTACADRRRFTD